jgi:hypothetical protein
MLSSEYERVLFLFVVSGGNGWTLMLSSEYERVLFLFVVSGGNGWTLVVTSGLNFFLWW